jgi:hypothetical protein
VLAAAHRSEARYWCNLRPGEQPELLDEIACASPLRQAFVSSQNRAVVGEAFAFVHRPPAPPATERDREEPIKPLESHGLPCRMKASLSLICCG